MLESIKGTNQNNIILFFTFKISKEKKDKISVDKGVEKGYVKWYTFFWRIIW